ncbi:MAG TPA: transcription termination factor Rho [Phycisphaerae bacterium]|nr:transcription termination factor Rho [Phycisphaerae bacterium]HNU43944.1 transcription termination factor Rho [Phycisphaerae bacterium]
MMSGKTQTCTGVFEPDEKGGGHLRSAADNYEARSDDPRLAARQCHDWHLIGGESVVAQVGAGDSRAGGRGREVVGIETIDDRSLDEHFETPAFETLTPIEPRVPMRFETPGGPATMRVLDLMTPIGFGQRGLIAAPPRTGKTILLQQMADGAAHNHPDLHLLMLLIDERPEEVTEMRRRIRGEVIASSNDQRIESHVRVARLIIARAKRLVETGRHVLVLLDSLTRLGRAFNAFIRGSGRIMSGGLDIRALTEPKAVFGAARNLEHGGSLTMIASALIETGSRMDDVIFSEFKGTGNMEIMLSRELANRRVWPAIDLDASGTRREELLLSPDALTVTRHLRRTLAGRNPERAMQALLDALTRYPDNAAFVRASAAQPPRL